MIQGEILDAKNSKYFNLGERGIRTLGTNRSYNGLAIRRFRPLGHLSNQVCGEGGSLSKTPQQGITKKDRKEQLYIYTNI